MESTTTTWTAQRPSGFALPVCGRASATVAAGITGDLGLAKAYFPGSTAWRRLTG